MLNASPTEIAHFKYNVAVHQLQEKVNLYLCFNLNIKINFLSAYTE